MGLREWLNMANQVQQMTERSGDVGASAAASIRQGLARQRLAAELPGMSAQQDIGGIAARAAEAGNFGPLQALSSALAQQQLQRSVKTPPLKPEQMPGWVPAEEIPKVTALKTYEAQQDYLHGLERERGLKQQAEQFRTSEQRRGEAMELAQSKNVQTQRKDFVKDFTKLEQEITEEERQIAKIKDAWKQGTVPSDNIIFNYIARAVAGEKGPLSNQDISRIQHNVFEGSAQRFQNFVTGQTQSALSAEQRTAFNTILNAAFNNFDRYKTERIGTKLSQAAVDYPGLKSGEDLDDAVTSRAKRFGFEHSDGAFKKKGQPTATEGDAAALLEKASKIKDPARKERAIRNIQTFSAKGLLNEAAIGRLGAQLSAEIGE